jgi:polysaccharide biosynthesis protein PslG
MICTRWSFPQRGRVTLDLIRRVCNIPLPAKQTIPALLAAGFVAGCLSSYELYPPTPTFPAVAGTSRLGHALAAETTPLPAAPSPTPAPNTPNASAHPAYRPSGSVSDVGFAAGSSLPSLSQAALVSELNGMKALGAAWVRYDIQWNNVEPAADQFNWGTYDRVVAAARSAGLQSLLIIDYTPTWAAVSGCSSFACEPASANTYGAFAAAVASRYAPYGVQDYEIWNEPNNAGYFAPRADPNTYAAMLAAAYQSIKQVQPQATIVSGGLAPESTDGTNMSPPDFLNSVYAAGGGPYFNVVGDHPYTFPVTAAYPNPGNAWGQMTELHAIMAGHGDGAKPIWITEYGTPTGGPGPTAQTNSYSYSAYHVSEALQAETVTDFFARSRALPWVGLKFWYSYQDSGTSEDTNENFFGLLRADGSPKPAYSVFAQDDR